MRVKGGDSKEYSTRCSSVGSQRRDVVGVVEGSKEEAVGKGGQAY